MLAVSVRRRQGEFRLDVAFEAPTPGVIALFGRSGCGKTTVVDLIAGLRRADSGRIEIDGAVLLDTARGIAIPAERRRVGYVFQDGRLFPHLDVRGNLAYGQRRARGSEVRVGFEEIVALLGLASLLERRVHQLSGGEKQRVALGRALLAQPRLLLLDEPLAALDQARREEVLPYLERLRDQLALPMLLVTHDYDEVLRLATHVVLMDRGRRLAQGPPTQLSLAPELRAIVGPEAIGAVLEGVVLAVDADAGLARVGVAGGALSIEAGSLAAGQRVRLQLLARDLILATERPHALSVRNALAGRVAALEADGAHATLVQVDAGGTAVIVRVTAQATHELGLRAGLPVWVLVKAVTLRTHVFQAGTAHAP
ncbi:MAG: molybdenum ABC transporter ATP-binding protein [Gammaproteobacteria bacterium]|nr:molybdenum ABC transporter ATP-binding protein [Gammaproteobacteria bacterium]